MPTAEQFLLRYPEFELQSDDKRLGLFLSDAALEVDKKRWTNLYERGVLALTAHLLTLALQAVQNQGNPHRTLASESAGELSVSYATPSGKAGDEWYQLTAYGQEFLRLRRLVGIGAMVV